MRRTVKRESEATGERSRKRETDDKTEQLKSVKKMKQAEKGNCSNRPDETQEEAEQGISDRRILRSQYLALQNRISDSKDDLMRNDSDKFSRIINEVENLHQHVRKPREQIADAEALLDIANTLMSSVKSQSSSHGVSPAEFVNALLSTFGQGSLGIDDAGEPAQVSINWKDLGFDVSSAALISCGCSTMLGPIDTEPKQRKKAANRKRARLGEGVRPDEVDDTESEEKTDTDKNMAIMFDILRQKKRVRLESLVLNRRSFAQTVENLFALSFLAKDGRVEIIVDQSGSHFALPRNAPATNLVMTGEVVYNHFVFRLDFKDWKMMSQMVPIGEELMPDREIAVASSSCPSASADFRQDSQTTPIRKLSRNRGLVVQEETVVEDTPDTKEDGTRRRCKRRLTSS